MRVQYQDEGFGIWPQTDSQQGLRLGIRIPPNHYRPSAPCEVGVKSLQLPLKPSSTGNVAEAPLGSSEVFETEAGLYTADPVPGAPEPRRLVTHVLQCSLHVHQPGNTHRPAVWPRAQRLQSSVSAAPAPVIQAVAAIVIVEVVA